TTIASATTDITPMTTTTGPPASASQRAVSSVPPAAPVATGSAVAVSASIRVSLFHQFDIAAAGWLDEGDAVLPRGAVDGAGDHVVDENPADGAAVHVLHVEQPHRRLVGPERPGLDRDPPHDDLVLADKEQVELEARELLVRGVAEHEVRSAAFAGVFQLVQFHGNAGCRGGRQARRQQRQENGNSGFDSRHHRLASSGKSLDRGRLVPIVSPTPGAMTVAIAPLPATRGDGTRMSSRARPHHDAADQRSAAIRPSHHYTVLQRFYDRMFSSLAIHYPLWLPGTSTMDEALQNPNRVMAEAAGVARGMHVLDAGCGLGHSAFWLAETFGVRVTGISIADSNIERCREI